MTASPATGLYDAMRSYAGDMRVKRRASELEETRASGAADPAAEIAKRRRETREADADTAGAVAADGGAAAMGTALDAEAAGGEAAGSDAALPGIKVRDPKEHAKNMRTAAEHFSGFFMGFMLKEMRKTVETNPFGHGSDSAEKVFQELADEAYGDEAAMSRTNALTELVYKSLMNGAAIPKMA